MSGFNDYEMIYEMATERYDEKLRQAERQLWIRKFLANQQAKAGTPSRALQAVFWAFTLFGLRPY